MNNVFAALVVGLVAGVGGALTLHLLGGMSGGDDGDGASVDLAPIEQRLGTIERELQAIRNPPETLTSPAMREGARAGAGAALPGGDEAVESLLAKIDERVGKTVERKFEEMKAGDDEKKEGRNARPERRRVSLARAAQELELTGQQEDELRRIYQESQDKVFALLAKPDGDPEEVKREIMEAVGTPEGTGKIIGKYMPKVRPLRDRVLVRRLEEEEQKVGGIIVPDSAKEKPQKAEVVAVGSGRLLDDGKSVKLTLKKKDKVLIGKWSGTEVKLDGEEYLILKEDEVLAILG